MDRKQRACELFNQGYSCAQAVVGAFEDVLPYDLDTLLNISIAFGGGFGRTRNLCGSVSAIGIVLGLKRAEEKANPQDKASVYKLITECDNEFKARNKGLDNCGQLLQNVKNITEGYIPQTRDEQYYATRPCIKFVLDSVDIIQSKLGL